MGFIRHRQRAITSHNPVKGQGNWINPNKAGDRADPLPDTSVPAVSYRLEADVGVSNSSWRDSLNDAVPRFDSTGDFRFTMKFRADVGAGGGSQTAFYPGAALSGQFQINNGGRPNWVDSSSLNFNAMTVLPAQWYLVEFFGSGDGFVTCWLRELPSGNHVAGSPQTLGGGTFAGSAPNNVTWRIGDSGATPTQTFVGLVGDTRVYVDGKMVFHCPIDEGGVSTQILERVRNRLSGVIAGTGSWVPMLAFATWAGFAFIAGESGGTNAAVLSQSQFTAETGLDPPRGHTGDVLKVECFEEDTTVTLQATGFSADVSTWDSWTPRFYVSKPDFDSYRQGNGRIWFRQRPLGAVDNRNMHIRGLQPNLCGLAQQGFNFAMVDPNDPNWIVGPSASFPQNFNIHHEGAYVPGVNDRYEVEIVTPTVANGFVSPLTAYFFDWIIDCGKYAPPIKVGVLWDDSSDDCHDVIHPLALTHGIKNTVMTQTDFIGGQKLDQAEYDTLRTSGLWEFAGHAHVHTGYDTRNAQGVGGVAEDIATNRATMVTLGIDTGSYNIGSTPFNTHYETLDGVDIATLQRAGGQMAARKGHYGVYCECIGVPNPYKVGGFILGQVGPDGEDAGGFQLVDYANWTRIHAAAKAMGYSYNVWGHLVVPAAPVGGNEFLESDLNLIFADLATDIAAGTVESVFLSEFMEVMGVKV